MCEWSGSEIKDLKVSLSEAGKAHRREREARLAAERLLDAYRKAYIRECNLRCELRNDLDDKKAELADMRADLAGATTTLGAFRESHGKMSKANSELRKSVSDLEDTIRTLTEERDISRELFRGMVGEYADLVDRYTVKCDDYEGLASRYDVEHGEL